MVPASLTVWGSDWLPFVTLWVQSVFQTPNPSEFDPSVWASLAIQIPVVVVFAIVFLWVVREFLKFVAVQTADSRTYIGDEQERNRTFLRDMQSRNETFVADLERKNREFYEAQSRRTTAAIDAIAADVRTNADRTAAAVATLQKHDERASDFIFRSTVILERLSGVQAAQAAQFAAQPFAQVPTGPRADNAYSETAGDSRYPVDRSPAARFAAAEAKAAPYGPAQAGE